MKEKTGQIFSITKDNPTVAGCTVSKSIYSAKGYDFTYFSLAEYTDISAETYEYPKICIVNSGKMEVYTSDNEVWKLSTDESIVPWISWLNACKLNSVTKNCNDAIVFSLFDIITSPINN